MFQSLIACGMKVLFCCLGALYIHNIQYSRCSFFMLLRRANAIKAWANAIKISTNTNKNGFLLPTKCLEGVLKYSYYVSIMLNFLLMFADFLSWVCEFYNHIKLIFYEVIKNRQNNHIIPFYFYSMPKIIFQKRIILHLI